jgi:hypothetical protein
MTFHPKGLFTLVGFVAIVLIGVSARDGRLDPMWAIAGAAAYVIVEAVMFVGPMFLGGRTRAKR